MFSTCGLQAAASSLRKDVLFGGVEPWQRATILKELWNALDVSLTTTTLVCKPFLPSEMPDVDWLYGLDARVAVKEVAEV